CRGGDPRRLAGSLLERLVGLVLPRQLHHDLRRRAEPSAPAPALRADALPLPLRPGLRQRPAAGRGLEHPGGPDLAGLGHGDPGAQRAHPLGPAADRRPARRPAGRYPHPARRRPRLLVLLRRRRPSGAADDAGAPASRLRPAPAPGQHPVVQPGPLLLAAPALLRLRGGDRGRGPAPAHSRAAGDPAVAMANGLAVTLRLAEGPAAGGGLSLPLRGLAGGGPALAPRP